VTSPLCAQNWTSQDSLRLQQLLNDGGELRLNPEALEELRMESPLGTPKADADKSWLDFDTSLPEASGADSEKVVLTLRPYTANTRFDWDPIRQKKIKIDKHTWRGPFYELKTLMLPTNWAKNPLEAGPRERLEQIEATGLRYRVTERANNMAVGRWVNVGGSTGMDFMKFFTKDFWNFKAKKRRAATRLQLQMYGDSITVREKMQVN
ncbi:MAG: DUF4858 domain-containing protein, partial [Bacteroides sp.]|nr:DUF4858 domain-containing protein [Bacteroides sp.]